jgi:glucose-1-phosphate cytidylyltransferase
MTNNDMRVHQNNSEPWTVTLVDTGEDTMTGGRLKRIKNLIKDEELFCFTYGDGLGNIDISNLIKFHKSHRKKATITATRPPARYGALKFGTGDIVSSFQEKPEGEGNWINGGFFVLSPDVIDLIKNDMCSWEEEPLRALVEKKQLYAYKHEGFWQPMDTLKEKMTLNELWHKGKAPWKIWK